MLGCFDILILWLFHYYYWCCCHYIDWNYKFIYPTQFSKTEFSSYKKEGTLFFGDGTIGNFSWDLRAEWNHEISLSLSLSPLTLSFTLRKWNRKKCFPEETVHCVVFDFPHERILFKHRRT
jgi:hypothetical protein